MKKNNVTISKDGAIEIIKILDEMTGVINTDAILDISVDGFVINDFDGHKGIESSLDDGVFDLNEIICNLETAQLQVQHLQHAVAVSAGYEDADILGDFDTSQTHTLVDGGSTNIKNCLDCITTGDTKASKMFFKMFKNYKFNFGNISAGDKINFVVDYQVIATAECSSVEEDGLYVKPESVKHHTDRYLF